MSKENKYLTPKRLVAIISALIAAALIAFLTYFLWSKLNTIASSPEALRDVILSYGAGSYAVGLGIQVLQVFVALIPGELVELALGYSFGFLGGTAVCLLGIAIATVPIFLLTKKLGVRFAEIFVDREKIEQLSFIKSETKLKRLIFLLFFIPGTPKDLLTYFVGLTPLSLGDFLIITLTARIPSIVTSTASGYFFAEGNYLTSAVIYAVTGALSLFGIWSYKRITSRRKSKKSDR